MLTYGSHTVRASKSPRNVRIAFHHGGLSHFGGAYFFHEFVRVLHMRHFLAEQIRYPRQNQGYSVSQMLLALVYPIVLGLDRIETASLLRSDGTFHHTLSEIAVFLTQSGHRLLNSSLALLRVVPSWIG